MLQFCTTSAERPVLKEGGKNVNLLEEPVRRLTEQDGAGLPVRGEEEAA